jgi:ATP-dependent RNA helicase DeaD
MDANVMAAANAGGLFDTSVTFKDLGLRASVLKGLDGLGFKHPTKIQALLIPHLMQGKDMLGQARTGTGKTGAFGLPILHNAERETPFQALIMVPTRELCVQVAQEMQDMGEFTPIKTVAVYGGERMQKQIDALRHGPQVVVSTPGRLMDMIERGHINLKSVKFAVLDEVDRMLDIGFREDIRRILGMCPAERQTVFVSATISAEIERLAGRYSRNPEKVVAVDSGPLTTKTVKQYHLPVARWDKRRLLVHLLKHEEPGTTLVFCKMKRTVDELEKYLNEKGIEAHAIHGDKAQAKRTKTIEKLKAGKLSVLIASDLVARGIDVEGISHVINYDLPEDSEVYVHRIGRTARIGREGVAWALVTPEDGPLLTAIEKLIDAEIPKLDYPDFEPSPPPPGRGHGGRGGSGGSGPIVVSGPGMGPGGAGAPAEPAKPLLDRMAKTMNPLAAMDSKPDDGKFPGGVVPTKLPPNRMFGRMTSRKGR